MTLNSGPPFLHLSRAEITGMCQHTWFKLCWELNPVLYIFLSGAVPISCTATFDLDGLFFFKNIVLMMTFFKFNVWHYAI